MNFTGLNFSLDKSKTMAAIDGQIPDIGTNCVNWCQEQQFITYHNIKTKGLMFLMGMLLIRDVGKIFVMRMKDVSDEKKLAICNSLDYFVTIGIPAFCLWAAIYLP